VTDLDWLRQQLARYTYRPGWTMEIERGLPLGMSIVFDHRICVAYCAPDSRNPDRDMPVQGKFSVPCYVTDQRDEKAFAEWLQRTLFEVERHESREWLRRDGQIHDDPHADE